MSTYNSLLLNLILLSWKYKTSCINCLLWSCSCLKKIIVALYTLRIFPNLIILSLKCKLLFLFQTLRKMRTLRPVLQITWNKLILYSLITIPSYSQINFLLTILCLVGMRWCPTILKHKKIIRACFVQVIILSFHFESCIIISINVFY